MTNCYHFRRINNVIFLPLRMFICFVGEYNYSRVLPRSIQTNVDQCCSKVGFDRKKQFVKCFWRGGVRGSRPDYVLFVVIVIFYSIILFLLKTNFEFTIFWLSLLGP